MVILNLNDGDKFLSDDLFSQKLPSVEQAVKVRCFTSNYFKLPHKKFLP